ncbi:YdhK family protein [Bacillus testis]|uniref:YdhK family protein n=1 Tax=Bacillus testis TaxID=1622072 RepID=UPI00067ECC14|nr:YdhK family protein [Bacillus testis]
MKNKKFLAALFSLLLVFALAACNGNDDGNDKDNNKDQTTEQADKNDDNATETEDNNKDENDAEDTEDNENMDGMEMHDDSGNVPEGLTKAENPKYEVGSKVIIKADHMKGMKNAEATVVGAYDTTAYMLDYKPTDGGDEVKNHKWIIQQELKDAGDKKLEKGTEVTIDANHMKGMEGAKANVVSSEDTTVYMVDYQPTTGGDKVKNHKWLVESELEAAK